MGPGRPGRLWVAGLVIVFALSGWCHCDSGEAGKANQTVSAANDTTIELDEDEHELLPDAEPLIGDHEWVELPDDGSEDDGTEDEGDDIEAAGSEVVSTVVKHDENGQVEGEEPGMRRRRKKGRKRRRRMRKRPRTTTPVPGVEGEVYPTPAAGATEEHPEPEKAPVQEEAQSPKESEGEQAYPRRRPGKRRRRPRPSTEAPEPHEIQDNRSPESESPVPEVVSEEPSSPRPRRRKRPKNRNRIPVEVPETGVPNNAEEIPPKTEERLPILPENHKQYESSTQSSKDDFAPVSRPKGNNDNSIQFEPPPSSKETFGGDQKIYVEQSSREASRFNGNENVKGSEKQNIRKPVTNKPLVLSTEYPTVEQKPKDYSAVEQRPKDYPTVEQRPKEYSTTGQRPKDFPTVEQKPRDFLPVEPKPKDYPTVEQKFKDYSHAGQKLKDFPIIEQKPKDYQSFGPTNRPNSNKQFQPQNTKFVELNPLNIDHNKYLSASPGPQTISFKTNGYDGFQQFQKLYGDDPGFNNTQLNRLKINEPTRAQTEKALKPTAPSRNQNENTEDKFQHSAPSKFSNQSPTSKVPDNNYSNYNQGFGLPRPAHGSLLHTQKDARPEQERPNHSEQYPIPNKFPHQKQQTINIPQAPPQYNKPKLIGMKEPEAQSTTYKPSFAAKPQNENPLIIQNRPAENQYAKSQTKTNNYPPQESINTAQRNKGNPQGGNYDTFPKGSKPENPFVINTRFPNIPQQNILRQIASQNPQFPAQASVLVSDDIETNSAKPQFNNNINDLNNKLKPPQSIEQFNHQLVDPTLLTSPVLFEPQLPPVFEDDVPATKSTVSKVHLPPIQYPKAKFPPAPFLPSSQKQLPNTQFQRQAEPAPFRLPQKPELPSTAITLPTQGTFQQPFSNQNKKAPPQILPTVQSQNEISKQVVRKPEPELDDEEIKSFAPVNNVQPTTTVESETIGYVEAQTTKTPDPTTRKSLFNQAKRLPPTSAVIRRKVRPRPLKNVTTENTQTTAAENLSEKYRGTGHRKTPHRQHLTEIEPSKVPEFDTEQNGNEDGLRPSSGYGDDGQLTQDQETTNVRYQEKTRYTTSYPETSADETTSAKPGRFGLHHVSAQQEILRQTLQKQGKDTNREEENTSPPFVPYKSSDEVEIPEDSFHETNPTPAFTTSKKTYSFTPRKPGHRHRTKAYNNPVTTPTTPRYTSLEIITDKPKYSAADEYEFMVSDEELLKMMKPMMGDDFTDQRDTEDLRFKAANIHGVKDEILDLIKTDSGSARLSRILKLRNMSLDDLIKHRERGSSQLHLSEIFTRNKEHEIESTAQPRPTDIFAVPGFAQNSEDDVAAQITPIFESNYIKNKGESDRIKNTAIVTEIRTSSNYGGNQFDDDRDNNREPKVFESMPSFTLRTDILEKLNERKEIPPQKTDSNWRFFGQVSKPQRPYEDVVISYTSTNRYPYRKPSVEEIDDIILLSDTEQYDAPRSNVIHAKVLADSGGERRDQEFFNETKKLSTGVKSAILVSGAIIGIAVLGFFALMISCRIKQKKARLRAQRDILCDHFHEELRSSARSTSPVMPEENTCEHGVRSTAIPTRHYNNRHYYLWRTLRKTFQYE